VQRHGQAQVVNDFVDEILGVDPRAHVLVLGDLNDFEFSETLSILQGGVLENLVLTLRRPERYTYVFEGNSQVLDHILASKQPYRALVSYDIVHVNAEFTDQAATTIPRSRGSPLTELIVHQTARSRAVEPPTWRTRRRGSRESRSP
jgi:hypothetical protein